MSADGDTPSLYTGQKRECTYNKTRRNNYKGRIKQIITKMLKLPFEVVQVEPAKPWEFAGKTGTTYKANVLIDDVLVVLRLIPSTHTALASVKRGSQLSGDFMVVKSGKSGDPVLVLSSFSAK